MNSDLLFLRQNIQVEPLVDRWYAWPHLIAPATFARNVTERHLRIMDSYINQPQLHASAVKNPKMLGGPFIDYQGKRVDEIRALRDRTKTERKHLLELSSALGALDALLMNNAKGFSMHPLYDKVPQILKGYVELVYDRNNQPSFRLIEPLLYRSRYYDRSLQSLMLQTISGDDRPFILSTPRLDSDDAVHLGIAFDEPAVDELFRLKSRPRRWSEIREKLQLEDVEAERLKRFFTTEQPGPYKPYDGPGARWRYFGHACILVEAQGISILVDPVLSYTYEAGISRYTYLDLPDRIDYVLITHNHQDHVLFETLLQLRHKIKNILVPRNGSGQLEDPSLKLLLESCGFSNVTEMTEMEALVNGEIRITGLPFFGEHADLSVNTKLAWNIRTRECSLVFVADSCNVEPELYRHVQREIGEVDVIFLGMECDGAPLSWIYGPLLTGRIDRAMDESRRLSGSNCEQGMRIIETFGCKEAYVYAMGQEPWLNYIMSIKYTSHSRPIIESNLLMERCRERGVVAERLFGEKEIMVQGARAEAQVTGRIA
ncbi:MAG TPA: MBL fold metallo-hydrolase [Candidatus Angelobacter sp.]|jgi:L-ascorbate metabolism protein UlaG (beta-lactamase superfamily)|nr:MBL fold metallo-hydrolase [Candidatus Angelobacter sp.]